MVLWWIGNAILLLVVLPVVIFLLNRVLAAVERIRGATDDILSGAGLPSSENSTACQRRWPSPTPPSRKSRSERSGTPVPSPSFSARSKH